MKKISILIALILSLTMITTSCKKVEKTKGDNSTSSSQGSGDSDSSDPSDPDKKDSTSKTETTTAERIITTKEPIVTTEMPKESAVRYAYNSLSADEKDAYASILGATKAFQVKAVFKKPISFKSFQKAFALVYFQEPELFWINGQYEVFDEDTNFTPIYYKADQETVAKMQAELDAKVKQIMDTIPQGATTIDKLKVFHDYIAKNCSFTKDGDYAQTVYGALVQGKTQCEGYAKAMGYLCDKAGIENMLQVGTNAQKASHAWNIVKIDGEWYNIDVTWDDPTDKGYSEFVRYTYFNVTDAEILNKSHFQNLSYFTPPKCTATKANYQIYYKLYADSYDNGVKLIKEQLIAASNEKRREVQIKVSSKAVLDELNSKLVDKKEIFNMIVEANKTAKNKFKEGTVTPVKDDNVLTLQFVFEYK